MMTYTFRYRRTRMYVVVIVETTYTESDRSTHEIAGTLVMLIDMFHMLRALIESGVDAATEKVRAVFIDETPENA